VFLREERKEREGEREEVENKRGRSTNLLSF
jgi:hypothetical protein